MHHMTILGFCLSRVPVRLRLHQTYIITPSTRIISDMACVCMLLIICIYMQFRLVPCASYMLNAYLALLGPPGMCKMLATTYDHNIRFILVFFFYLICARVRKGITHAATEKKNKITYSGTAAMEAHARTRKRTHKKS